MTPWSAFSACTKSCGTGSKKKTRTVTVAAAYGGKACEATSSTTTCNTFACPVNCVVSAWTKWSSFKGGKAIVKRTRTVTTSSAFGGVACPSLEQTKHWHTTSGCKDKAEFGEWSACSKKCNSGHQYRLWEKVVCSKAAVLAFHLKFREGRRCNTFSCKFRGDHKANDVQVPKLKRHVVAAEMLEADLDESIGSWRAVTEQEQEEYGLARDSSWEVLGA
jgi:hypothetical protein